MTTYPIHYTDTATPDVCRWSEQPGDGTCPDGCTGSTEHYANDGHPGCQEIGPARALVVPHICRA